MVFSSTLFLFIFFPVTILGYYLIPGRTKNYWLLALSLVLNLITALCLIRSESFFINFFVYYLFSAIVAIYVSPMLIMLWNEIVSLTRRESQGIKILSAVLFTAGLFMIVLEYILLLCAIFMPTGSDFVVTDTMIIAYNLFPAGLLAAAAPIKLFS